MTATQATQPPADESTPPSTPPTDTDTTTDTADDTAEPDAGPERDTEPDDSNNEAARWRRRLREVEADRDRLAAVIDAMQTETVEQLAAEQLAAGSDLWVAGVTLADVRADDGTIDAAKVSAAANAIIEQRPHWAKPHNRIDLGQGPRGSVTSPPATPSWSDVLRRR